MFRVHLCTSRLPELDAVLRSAAVPDDVQIVLCVFERDRDDERYAAFKKICNALPRRAGNGVPSQVPALPRPRRLTFHTQYSHAVM